LDFGFTSWFSRTVSLPSAFRYLSAAGCTSVEIAGMPPYLTRERSITESVRRSGLDVVAVGLGVPFLRDPRLNLHSKDESVRLESVRFVKRGTDFAVGLGARIVYVCSVRRESGASKKRVLGSLRESLSECADHAEEAGVVLALESFPGGEVPRFDAAMDVVAAVKSRSLGVLLDTGHLAMSGEPIDDAVVRSKRVLKHVHVNNNDGLTDLHWPPQRGKLGSEEFRSFFCRLAESGYDGGVSIELANPRPIAKTITDSVNFLQRVVQ
jgi:sugar phosphate isomerase/epimerase